MRLRKCLKQIFQPYRQSSGDPSNQAGTYQQAHLGIPLTDIIEKRIRWYLFSGVLVFFSLMYCPVAELFPSRNGKAIMSRKTISCVTLGKADTQPLLYESKTENNSKDGDRC